jgi:hypothetical protein
VKIASPRTRRLAELRPGDQIWFEGNVETIEAIRPASLAKDFYFVRLAGMGFEDTWPEGAWAVPGDAP